MKNFVLAIVSLVIGWLPALGGLLGMVGPWYDALNKSSLTPPGWVFGPAWSVLYTLIGISLFMYLRTGSKFMPVVTLTVFGVHLLLNFLWSVLFFRWHSPGFALADILVLCLSLVFIMYAFYRTGTTAWYLLVPYLLWLLFATYLNLIIVVLN